MARIDLSSGSYETSEIDPRIRSLYLGGRGLNMWILSQHMASAVDAFHPDNPLIFGAGLLAGTAAPSSSRFNVSSRSPLTGFLGDSNCGGFWGPELRFAGFDHLVISGAADHPVYLWIQDGRIEFRNATHLWGMDTIEVQDAIREELGDQDIQITCIGPAGENLVRFACIRHHLKEAAGRTGMGAVMGSKMLKAIAVRGSSDAPVSEPAKLAELRKSILDGISSSKGIDRLRTFGTSFLLDAHQAIGCLPVKNHQASSIDGEDWQGLSAGRLKDSRLRMVGCFGCPVCCRPVYSVPSGRHEGELSEGPEYFAINALGARTGTYDLDTVLVGQDLCNRMGTDIGSAGNLIAWSMELYQRGIIDETVTGGLKLGWGDSNVILRLLDDIAHKKGLGGILAEGGLRAAEVFGPESENYFMHVKGMGVSTDERPYMGSALNTATSSRGADHLRSRPIPEGFGLPAETLKRIYGGRVSSKAQATDGKGRMVFESEKMFSIPDSLGICKFITRKFLSPEGLVGYEEFSDMLNAVAGFELNAADIEECGERITTLERLINLRLGLTREDDTLPRRYFEEETVGGRMEGSKIDRGKFETILDDYYALHGWDARGVPTPGTLQRLGIDDSTLTDWSGPCDPGSSKTKS